MSEPIYDGVSANGDGQRLFVGWEPRECGEHRSVGDYRAWCYDCSMWCYSRTIDMACRGCEIVHLRAQLCETCGHFKEWHDDHGCEPGGQMSGCSCLAFIPGGGA